MQLEPSVPTKEYCDGFGNICHVIQAPAGRLTITSDFLVQDSAAFAKGYSELTLACNACHQGIGRSFIVIQAPTASPFTDQSFSSPKR